MDFAVRSYIMGVLNVTPDSFSDGGFYATKDAALARADRLVTAGADVLDVGGESTRPGAEAVSTDEEIRRVVPVIREVAGWGRAPVSVDTYKADVAEAAVEAGAEMINDISAGEMDPRILEVAAGAGVPVVLSHIQGTPADMQRNPVYDDVVREVAESLAAAADRAAAAGVAREAIVVDPGIGFGKTLHHNLLLLQKLEVLAGLGYPLLVGTSRKSFIGKLLNGAPPEERLYGTAATVAIAIAHGAHVLRVHDVEEMAQVVRVTDAVLRARPDDADADG